MWLRLGLLVALLTSCSGEQPQEECSTVWEQYKKQFMETDGRIVDNTDGRSTSEGQAYGLFFALVENDKEAFANILDWTERNLADGDLTASLPAWHWGKTDSGVWKVIDDNSASDADLFIAYSLTEAGRLWGEPKYSLLASFIMDNILRHETEWLGDLGLVLLPGKTGYSKPDVVVVNPSYVPVWLLRRLANASDRPEWQQLYNHSVWLHQQANEGVLLDWMEIDRKTGQLRSYENAKSSYDAIRVQLWWGLTSASLLELPEKNAYLEHLNTQGYLPEAFDEQLNPTGNAPSGFYAAMLPLLQAYDLPVLEKRQRERLFIKQHGKLLGNPPSYYDQNLLMFGLGAADKRYSITDSGELALPARGQSQCSK